MNRFRVSLVLALTVIAMPLSGCGGKASDAPELHPVSGTITRGSTPVANVMITLVPENGGPQSVAYSDAEGTFSVTTQTGAAGAVEGAHKVVLSTSASAEVDESRYASGASPGAKEPAPFPNEYRSVGTTPLTVEVPAGGVRDLVIELPESS